MDRQRHLLRLGTAVTALALAAGPAATSWTAAGCGPGFESSCSNRAAAG